MPNTTYTEWVAEVFAAYSTHVKKNGDNSQTFYQFIPNHLSEVRPDIHHQLRGEEVDCYHTGDLAEYLNEVRRLWNVPKMYDVLVYESLIRRLSTQVEYMAGPRYNKRAWASVPEVSGVDTHDQTRLSDDEEDLLRQIMKITS